MAYIAEYHPRINTVTVCAEADASATRVSLQGNTLYLVGDDVRQYSLPCDELIAKDSTIVSMRNSNNIVQVTIKLQGEINGDSSGNDTTNSNGDIGNATSNQRRGTPTTSSINTFVESTVPSKWSCKDLQLRTPQDSQRANVFTFECANCNSTILGSTQFKFMDMPSEWWHELMEFWHCHKPHESTAGANALNNYNGILKPNLGTIIIGSYYLLSNSNDKTLAVKPMPASPDQVGCGHCNYVLGEYDKEGLFYKLMKWNLVLSYSNPPKCEQFPINTYFHELLVDRLNITATRWFQYQNKDNSWTHLWLINVGSDVVINGKMLSNALKLGYRIDSDEISDRDNLETLTFAQGKGDLLTLELSRIHELILSLVQPIQSVDGEYRVSYLSPE